MTVYLTVQVKIKDRAAYQRYSDAFMPVFEKFKGTMLAADFEPRIISGEWDKDRIVIMSFPDKGAMMEWLTSEEYKVIAADRDKGADIIALMAEGVEGPQ